MMETNPFTRHVYGCDNCHDFGMVSGRFADEPCPSCANLTSAEREQRRVARYIASLRPPSISQLDLDERELVIYRTWKAKFPGYSSATLLSWIEGLRYDPRKDPEFRKEGRAAFMAWRASRGREGPDPEWLRHPEGKDLAAWQRAVLAEREKAGV